MKLTLSKRLPAADLIRYAAEARWKEETSGIEVDGKMIATDREAQAMIANARAYLASAPKGETINFKTKDGFIELDRDGFEKIAFAVADHVQAAFYIESCVLEKIISGEIITIDDVEAQFH